VEVSGYISFIMKRSLEEKKSRDLSEGGSYSIPSKKAKIVDEVEESDTKIDEIFADPTFDITFKMLFGNDSNKDLLISLINNLLGFEGEREIIEVEINTNELPISIFASHTGKSGITSAVDILCTNKGKHKIAIEMQGSRY
jgi:hypothetical protein